jgi:hypothetical protein
MPKRKMTTPILPSVAIKILYNPIALNAYAPEYKAVGAFRYTEKPGQTLQQTLQDAFDLALSKVRTKPEFENSPLTRPGIRYYQTAEATVTQAQECQRMLNGAVA